MVVVECGREIGIALRRLRHGAIEIGEPVRGEHGIEVVAVDELGGQPAAFEPPGDVEGERAVRGEEENAAARNHEHMGE